MLTADTIMGSTDITITEGMAAATQDAVVITLPESHQIAAQAMATAISLVGEGTLQGSSPRKHAVMFEVCLRCAKRESPLAA
jgi:hypothetical protein